MLRRCEHRLKELFQTYYNPVTMNTEEDFETAM
jgi:hypothetical protein